MGKKVGGLSLVELLMAAAIFSLIVLAMFALAAFSYTNMINSGRRAVLQHECSLIIDHVTKYFGLTIGYNIGDTAIDGIIEHNSNPWWKARLDRNGNGEPDDDGANDWNGYRFDGTNNRVEYIITSSDNGWGVGQRETLVDGKITAFDINFNGGENFFKVTVTAVNNPAIAAGPNNPEVTMDAYVSMPMVSVR